MSQLLTKLSEFESQIDKKMKELKQQRQKLTGLQKALKPKVNKPSRIVKVEGSKSENIKENA